jgi:hypothetical protein
MSKPHATAGLFLRPGGSGGKPLLNKELRAVVRRRRRILAKRPLGLPQWQSRGTVPAGWAVPTLVRKARLWRFLPHRTPRAERSGDCGNRASTLIACSACFGSARLEFRVDAGPNCPSGLQVPRLRQRSRLRRRTSNPPEGGTPNRSANHQIRMVAVPAGSSAFCQSHGRNAGRRHRGSAGRICVGLITHDTAR